MSGLIVIQAPSSSLSRVCGVDKRLVVAGDGCFVTQQVSGSWAGAAQVTRPAPVTSSGTPQPGDR